MLDYIPKPSKRLKLDRLLKWTDQIMNNERSFDKDQTSLNDSNLVWFKTIDQDRSRLNGPFTIRWTVKFPMTIHFDSLGR